MMAGSNLSRIIRRTEGTMRLIVTEKAGRTHSAVTVNGNEDSREVR
jgi:hypothetical protein